MTSTRETLLTPYERDSWSRYRAAHRQATGRIYNSPFTAFLFGLRQGMEVSAKAVVYAETHEELQRMYTEQKAEIIDLQLELKETKAHLSRVLETL